MSNSSPAVTRRVGGDTRANSGYASAPTGPSRLVKVSTEAYQGREAAQLVCLQTGRVMSICHLTEAIGLWLVGAHITRTSKGDTGDG